jgi:hypothetical protein
MKFPFYLASRFHSGSRCNPLGQFPHFTMRWLAVLGCVALLLCHAHALEKILYLVGGDLVRNLIFSFFFASFNSSN